MGRGGIPDRWLEYSRVGKQIAGTRFIAFKVPLKEALCSTLRPEERFTPNDLLRKIPNLGFVIDLTNTPRYYDPIVFHRDRIGYQKIYCQGHGKLPQQAVIDTFFRTVDNFLEDDSRKGQLLGVHCTHGLNRTGYLICKYMVDKLGFDPPNAIQAFEEARRHKIERQEYLAEFQDQSHRRVSDNSLLPRPGSLGELMARVHDRKASLLPSPTSGMKKPLLPSPSYPYQDALLPRPQGGPKGLLPRPSEWQEWSAPRQRDANEDGLLGHSSSYSDTLLSRPISDALLPRPSSTKEPLLPHPTVSIEPLLPRPNSTKEPLLPRPHSTKEPLLPRPHSTKEPLLPPPGFTKKDLIPRPSKAPLLPSPSTPNIPPALLTSPPKEPLLASPLIVPEALLPSPIRSIGRGRAILRSRREPLLEQPPVSSLPFPVSPSTAPLGLGRGRGRGRGRSNFGIDPPIPDEAPPRKTLLDEPFVDGSRRSSREGGSGDSQSVRRDDTGRENSRDRLRRRSRDRSSSRDKRTLIKEEPMDYYNGRSTSDHSRVANGSRSYVGLGRGYGREDAAVYRRSHDFAPRMAGSGDSIRSLRFNSTSYERPYRN